MVFGEGRRWWVAQGEVVNFVRVKAFSNPLNMSIVKRIITHIHLVT
jgi:hypothetical protein